MVSEMIDSIIANTFQDWELLAVDDGASAEVKKVLSKYSKDSRIHFIERTSHPKGAQHCRNIGLSNARGEYIIFVDSDDYITPQCLETRVKYMEQNPDMDFMVFPSGTYNNKQFTSFDPKRPFGYPIYNDDITAFLRKMLPFVVWSNIYRAKSLLSHNISWDENILSLQDSDFNLQVLLTHLKYGYASCEPDYGYRIENNTASISTKIHTEEHFRSHLYCLEKFYKTVQEKHGHNYDFSLFLGVLFILSLMYSNGIQHNRVKQFTKLVKNYSNIYGNVLSIQVKLCRLLELFLSPSTSFTITMLPYRLYRHLAVQKNQKKALQIFKQRQTL